MLLPIDYFTFSFFPDKVHPWERKMSSRVHLIVTASGDTSAVEVSVLHATWTICSTHVWNRAEKTLEKKRKETETDRKRSWITTYLLFYKKWDCLHFMMKNTVMKISLMPLSTGVNECVLLFNGLTPHPRVYSHRCSRDRLWINHDSDQD